MVQHQRHIAVAVSKKLARYRGVKNADFKIDDDDDSEQYEVPDDLAATHTTKSAESYGVTVPLMC